MVHRNAAKYKHNAGPMRYIELGSSNFKDCSCVCQVSSMLQHYLVEREECEFYDLFSWILSRRYNVIIRSPSALLRISTSSRCSVFAWVNDDLR